MLCLLTNDGRYSLERSARFELLVSCNSKRPISKFFAPSPILLGMQARTYVFPNPGDDFATIAQRELPGIEGGDQQLLSWNLHLAARAGLGRSVGLLPSDVVFIEPPRAVAVTAAEPRK
jgi:hypothetical protein